MQEKQKQRRMAFYEIGRGLFAQQMQAEFEQAQIVALERNLPVRVTATILISPPDMKDPRFGLVGYKIHAAYPAIKSAVYTTKLKDGSIISDAGDVAELLQTKLDLFAEGNDKQLPFTESAAAGDLPQ